MLQRDGWKPAGFRIAVVCAGIALVALPALADAATLMFTTKGTSDKPQSKLWAHDGSWWAAINDNSNLAIYRLNAGTWTHKLTLQAAVNVLTTRTGSSDVLWTGTELFVVAWGSSSSKIYKLTYNAGTQNYVLASGFPVSVSMQSGSETVVIDQDTTGRAWISYEAGGKIYVHYTTTATHQTWSAATQISTTSVDPDDISGVVAFGNRIGVVWSDQVADKFLFRSRLDSDPPGTWQAIETIDARFGLAEDHFCAKADAQGRVFVVVKDRFEDVILYRRDADGTWNANSGATGLDCATRPILQIDDENNHVYVIYTRWATCRSAGVHEIRMRRSPLDAIQFGEAVTLFAPGSTSMNDPSGCKRPLPAGSQVVVCTSGSSAYWTGWGSVAGIGGTDPSKGPPAAAPAPTNLTATMVTESPSPRALLWRFDEASGTQASDASGNGRHGTLVDGEVPPERVDGIMGGSLYFGGSPYVVVDGTGLGFVNQSFTVEAWIKPDPTGDATKDACIVSRLDDQQSSYRLLVQGDSLSLTWSDSPINDVSIKSAARLRDGAWHHIAGVYDHAAGQGRLYLDGELIRTKSMAPPALTGSWDVTVGAELTPIAGELSNEYDGWIDLVAITGQALYNGSFVPPLLYPASNTPYMRVAWDGASCPEGVAGYDVLRYEDGLLETLSTASPPRWFADFAPEGTAYTVRTRDGVLQGGGQTSVGVTTDAPDDDAASRFGPELRILGSPAAARAQLQLTHAARAQLALFDVRGRRVRTVLDGHVGTGLHEFPLHDRRLGSGLYFLRLDTGSETRSVPVLILR